MKNRAAAKLPEAVLTENVADAAGRTGVAVARLNETSGQRTESIASVQRDPPHPYASTTG